MLPEEAIKRIQGRTCNEPEQRYCRDRCLYGVEECEFSMAIEALEKQIPESLNMRRVVDINVYYCPKCMDKIYEYGRTFIRRSVIIPDKPKYCYNCGQRLKWNEEN